MNHRLGKREIFDLTVSWLTISAAFAIAASGLRIATLTGALPITLVAVGTGFVLHELAHKYAALHYKAHAEFRMWETGLLIAILGSLVGFIFAAPGAVYIYAEHLSRKKHAIISIAGPLTNIGVALLFWILWLISANAFLGTLAAFGLRINLWLAWFNMIPFFVLDGAKVFKYSKTWWAALFIPLTLLVWIPDAVRAIVPLPLDIL